MTCTPLRGAVALELVLSDVSTASRYFPCSATSVHIRDAAWPCTPVSYKKHPGSSFALRRRVLDKLAVATASNSQRTGRLYFI